MEQCKEQQLSEMNYRESFSVCKYEARFKKSVSPLQKSKSSLEFECECWTNSWRKNEICIGKDPIAGCMRLFGLWLAHSLTCRLSFTQYSFSLICTTITAQNTVLCAVQIRHFNTCHGYSCLNKCERTLNNFIVTLKTVSSFVGKSLNNLNRWICKWTFLSLHY